VYYISELKITKNIKKEASENFSDQKPIQEKHYPQSYHKTMLARGVNSAVCPKQTVQLIKGPQKIN
jgi:hypothetical protein